MHASFQTTIHVCMYKYVFYLSLSWEDQQQGQQAKSNLGHKHGRQRPIMSKKKDLQKEPGHRSLVRQILQISTLFVMWDLKSQMEYKAMISIILNLNKKYRWTPYRYQMIHNLFKFLKNTCCLPHFLFCSNNLATSYMGICLNRHLKHTTVLTSVPQDS